MILTAIGQRLKTALRWPQGKCRVHEANWTARTAVKISSRFKRWPNTNHIKTVQACHTATPTEKHFAANIVTNFTCHSGRLKCTFALTLCHVSARFAARLSVDRGFCKVTSERTQERSHTSAAPVNALSLTAQTFEHISKHTLTLKNIAAPDVQNRFQECLYFLNTRTLAALRVFKFRKTPLTC